MRFALFFCLVINFSLVFAQQEVVFDTAKRIDPYHSVYHNFHRKLTFKEPTDSQMMLHHQYYFAKKNNVGIQDLGDMSTPYLDLVFTPNLKSGFNTGFNPFKENYFYIENAKFYNAKLPYTYFYYTQGRGLTSQGLVAFDASHTQNIGKNFNFSVNYHSTTNSGYYKRQTNVMKNIQLTSYYKSKNQRYLASGILTYNKTNFQENGGLKQDGNYTDSLFRALTTPVKFVDVELNNAKNINKFRQHQLSQTYWLAGKYSDDTLKEYSPQLGVRHVLQIEKISNYYTDLASDYKSVIFDSIFYFNSNGTNDSMRCRHISNAFELFSPIKQNGISFSAGARIDNISYHQQANSMNYRKLSTNNTSLYGQLNFNFLKLFNSDAFAQFYTTGYNQKDYYLKWKNDIIILKKQKINALISITSSARRPDYIAQNNISNHFIWQNNFNQITTQILSIGIVKEIIKPKLYDAYSYSIPKKSFAAIVNYTLTSNYIYFDYDSKPKVGSPDQNVLQFFAMKHLNLKKFQLHQELFYQIFSEKIKTYLLLPSFVSKTSLYYQFYAFKKATFIQIGTDVNYTNSYTANFYNPSTQNFQRSKTQVGNYPFIDVFINAEIKTAKLFFKMEHLNQDMAFMNGFENYYYNSPNQPSSPRRFRLGVAWKFYY